MIRTKNPQLKLSQTILILMLLNPGLAGATLKANGVSRTANEASPFELGKSNETLSVPFSAREPPLRIMCLGDSITAGYTDNPKWKQHPFEFGYRSGLYTLLSKAGYNFLMVGSSAEPWDGRSGDPTRKGTSSPSLDLREFGQDGHQGYSGRTAGFLNKYIRDWLAQDDPDIVLLMIGTNKKDQKELDTLVDRITTTKPDCQLIVAQIIPRINYDQATVDYNRYIRETLVPHYQAIGRKVTLVDQYAPFLKDPSDATTIDQALFSNGINHPSNDGYDKMAQVWFNSIASLDNDS